MRSALFAHLETWRPYTAFYVGLVGLAGGALSAPFAPAGRLAAAWAIPTLGWLACLYGGDYFDRHLDAQAKPHRPIPSDRLGARTALGMFIGCTVVGAVLSLLLNWRTVLLVVVTFATCVAYSKLLKGRGLSGNLARGSMTAFAFWYGSMMVASFPLPRVALLAVVFVLHDTASNLVGAVRDIDGDREGGYRTFAVRRGAQTATLVAGWLLLAAYGLGATAPALLSRTITVPFVAMLALAAAYAAWALAPMSGEPARRVAYRAHTVLVLARILLAGALLGLAPWAWLAPAIVFAALAATWISQRLLRERHEFSAPPGLVHGMCGFKAAQSALRHLPDFDRIASTADQGSDK